MENLIAILNKPLLQLGGESITLVQLLSVPLAFLLILFLAGWIARAVTGRMRNGCLAPTLFAANKVVCLAFPSIALREPNETWWLLRE